MKPSDLKHLDPERLLEALGIERERGPFEGLLPALGLFAAGLLVGAGVGVALAPRISAVMRLRLEEEFEESGSRPDGSQPH